MTANSAGYEQPFRLMLGQRIPMRDGVNLLADIYLPNPSPAEAGLSPSPVGPSLRASPVGAGLKPAPTGESERYPTALIRSPYNNKNPRYVKWAVGFVKAGYAVVMQDCRGRHDSDGSWDPYMCEIPDGYDTHEWITQQPWSDGQIGTFGISYPGFTQTAPAPDGSKALKALVPIASQQDNYGHHRMGGVLQWYNTYFFPNISFRVMQTEALNQLVQAAIARRLPLVSAWDGIVDNPYFRKTVETVHYGEFFHRYSLRHRYSQVDVPGYFITGWYDSLLHETIKVFNGWHRLARSPEARRFSKLLIGPWSHNISPFGGPGTQFEFGPNGEFKDAAMGPDAWLDPVETHLRWYDARMKDVKNGMDEEPPVKLFLMGANRWRFADGWPLPGTKWTDFYLHGSTPDGLEGQRQQGSLSLARPDSAEAPDRFRYDPDDPVPTWGGQFQGPDLTGPRDRREIEKRSDILIYTSEPLQRDIEVAGPVSACIWAATSAPDTDFTATLIDVYPDGRAIILCQGIVRARFRKSNLAPWSNGRPVPELVGMTPTPTMPAKAGIQSSRRVGSDPRGQQAAPLPDVLIPDLHEETIEPGRAYEYWIDMWDIGNVFLKGHRIRLEVSSSCFPLFDRNLNTGDSLPYGTNKRVAHQTVFHEAGRASFLRLPVIPN